jgi:glucose/arabinose dehydrogenase
MRPSVSAGIVLVVGLCACGGASPAVRSGDAGRVVATNAAPAAPITTVAPITIAAPVTPPPADSTPVPVVSPPASDQLPPAAVDTTLDTTVPEPVTTVAPPPVDPLPPIAQIETASIATQQAADLEHPVAMAWNPADGSLYIAGQNGQIWRFDEAGQPQIVHDMADRVTPFADGSERGLLGLAFSPDGRMFLDFTDIDNDTNVVSMAMNGVSPDPATEWPVLFIEQPGLGHKGGTLVFDRAGNLYVAMGDGGASNGRDAQDPTKLLGTILRVHPKPDGPGYDIPPDNPFVNDPVIRPEKWIFGFRNPWKFSIDDDTGDLWLGDVGNSDWEEIDRMPAGGQGANYGWYWFEGTHQRHSGAPPDVVPPVWEWSHEVGVSAIGGYVYRGSAIPALRGSYVFGDLTGTIWAVGVDGVQKLPVRLKGLVSFGEDPTGELWMTSLWGPVVKIVPT